MATEKRLIDAEGICKYEDRQEVIYKLTPKGCASVALKDAKLIESSLDPAVDVFWDSFAHLMEKFGYVQVEEGEKNVCS